MPTRPFVERAGDEALSQHGFSLGPGMITTLWVAIGGALGSIARYWMAIGVARLTGPAFPWGTILINILGSFVIGLFAAATAPGTGRMAVPTDFRTFVMVGICGGFTTFSSFSLQTLELIRQNQMPQAAANILLSVFLCLAAVGLGYYSGGPAGTVAKLLFEQSSRG